MENLRTVLQIIFLAFCINAWWTADKATPEYIARFFYRMFWWAAGFITACILYDRFTT